MMMWCRLRALWAALFYAARAWAADTVGPDALKTAPIEDRT
jgi:hypothetical protein